MADYSEIISKFDLKCSDSFDAWSIYVNKKGWSKAAIEKGRKLSLKYTGGKCGDCLARVMLSESGGDPQADNGNCVGLIQFCPPNFTDLLKVPKEKVKAMNAEQQLDLVDIYYAYWTRLIGRPFSGPGEMYGVVFLPGRVANKSNPLTQAPEKFYTVNNRLDFNKDNAIDFSDLELEVYRFGANEGFGVPPPCKPLSGSGPTNTESGNIAEFDNSNGGSGFGSGGGGGTATGNVGIGSGSGSNGTMCGGNPNLSPQNNTADDIAIDKAVFENTTGSTKEKVKV